MKLTVLRKVIAAKQNLERNKYYQYVLIKIKEQKLTVANQVIKGDSLMEDEIRFQQGIHAGLEKALYIFEHEIENIEKEIIDLEGKSQERP